MFEMPADMTPVPVEINQLDNQALVRYYEREWRRVGVTHAARLRRDAARRADRRALACRAQPRALPPGTLVETGMARGHAAIRDGARRRCRARGATSAW